MRPVDVGGPGRPFRILIANSSLARMVMAFAWTTIAEWGYVTALAVDAFRRDGAIAVSIVGLRLFLAATATLVGGAFVHRRPSGRILSQISVARAAGVAVTAALAASGAPLATLLVLLGLDSIASAQYRPAQSALVPRLARTPMELIASATGFSTVKTLSQALGSVLGGVLLELVSPALVFSGVAVIFLATAGLTFRFKLVGYPAAGNSGSAGLGGTLRATLRAVGGPPIANILVVSGLRTFVRGMWFAIAVIASLRLLHAGSAGLGLLMLAGGTGALLAAPLASMLVTLPRVGTPTAIALMCCGMPLALVAGVPVFGLALALVVVWGVAMALADVATSSLVCRLVQAPLVPRVTGAIESTKLALEGLGGFLAPLLISTAGVRVALLVAAAPLPIVAVGGWKNLHQVDDSARERSAKLQLLHGVHCLRPLDLPSLDELVGRLTRLWVTEAGTEVVRQGDRGDRFYVVEAGTAEVLINGFVVGVVGPGDSFGERALLRDAPRAATVRSTGPLQLLVLSQEDFLTAMTGQEGAPMASYDLTSRPGKREWTQRQRAELLSRVAILSHLDSNMLEALAARSIIDEWPEGARIIRQGDKGDRFFVMLDGHAKVVVGSKPVTDLQCGDPFGEIAVLYDVAEPPTSSRQPPQRLSAFIETTSCPRYERVCSLASKLWGPVFTSTNNGMACLLSGVSTVVRLLGITF